MTEAQAAELLELTRRIAAGIEQLVRARPRQHERRLHPKRHVARALGISRSTLTRYLKAGVIRTVRSSGLDRVADEELQRHLANGLPELEPLPEEPQTSATPTRKKHRRASSPRPPASSPSEKPGDKIRALRIE